MILTIAYREFKTLFVSPLAWSILATVQFLLAYLFLGRMEDFTKNQGKLAYLEYAPGLTEVVIIPLFHATALIFLAVSPLLTMRLICEERRNKSLVLLLAAPISETQIVLGKYLAVIGFSSLIIMMISLMPLSLLSGGEIDYGKLITNIISVFLTMISCSAVGLYMSSIANHIVMSALGSFSLLLFLLMLNWQTFSSHENILAYLSLMSHLQVLQSGLLNTSDISYFMILTGIFLVLTIRRLTAERLGL
ncbi:MAG: hypothetical protein RL637_522 [Pseudomonadota bacterium]|jgi:ABC-2 type transport system permease protein